MPKQFTDAEKRAYWQGVGAGKVAKSFSETPSLSKLIASFPNGDVRESALQGVRKGMATSKKRK